MKNTIKKKKKPFNRFFVLIIIMGLIFFAIISRLIYLQVYKHVEYSDRANTRSRRFLAEKAPRGKIYDSQGNLLATNVQTYAISFVETDEANKVFFSTMAKVFKLLDENNEKQIDEFKLKINDDGEPYFDFGNITNSDTLKALEIRFKRDRGLDFEVKKKLFPKKEGDLSDEEETKINQELMKITPKETFEYLIKNYELYRLLTPNPTKEEEKEIKKRKAEDIANELTQKYSMNFLRRYMVVKDKMKMQSFSGFKPVALANNISKNTAFIFLQKLNDIPGINVNLEPMRYYPYHELASGALGYISSINPDKSEKYKEKGYDVSTDQIGVSGIEGSFESLLKGTKGGDTVKVNSAGRKIEELFKLEPSPGENIHLTIDKNIQYSAEQMMKHQVEWLQTFPDPQVNTKNATRAAAIAIEAKTGRVLALVSYPEFDPNVFSTPGGLTPDIMKKYFNTDLDEFGKKYISKIGLSATLDDLFPKDSNGNRQDKYDVAPKATYNYATQGLIPPGSTFKPMTGLAALEEGVINDTDTVVDIGDKPIFNEHPEVLGKGFSAKDNDNHGVVDFRTAIQRSCNHFFYECGYRMYMKNGQNPKALDTLANYAWKFGLGIKPGTKEKATTGIELSENFGQVYNFESFKKQTAYYSKFELVNQLESGSMGPYRFIPLDIVYNEEDDDDLKKAKKDLKDLITDRLRKVGTDEFDTDKDIFNRKLKEDIESLKKCSSKYRDNISKYESSGKKYSLNATVAAIEQFIINKKVEITSPAQIVYASIGQGMDTFTPVQIASYITTLVNGGTRYKVHMVDKITNFEGKTIDEFKPEVLNKVKFKPQNLQIIKEAMQRTNSVEYGTAFKIFKDFPISTGGKTGSATFQEGKQKLWGREDFSVYVSFAPVEDPEIVVATTIYDGGHGCYGAPVARAIFETYFRDKIKKEFPDYKPKYTYPGGEYDYSLNPPLQDIKDDGVHKSEAEDKIQKQKDEEKQKQLERQKQEKEVEQQKEEMHRVKRQQRRHFKKRRH